jgi:hypothetical protein
MNDETKKEILFFFLNNVNNSVKNIAAHFGIKENAVHTVLDEGFKKVNYSITVETYIVLESKMNSET